MEYSDNFVVKKYAIRNTLNIWWRSANDNPNNDAQDQQNQEDNADHHLFVFPPHSIPNFPWRIFQIVWLVAHDLTFLHQDLDFLTPFNHLVHIPQRNFLQLGELLLQFA